MSRSENSSELHNKKNAYHIAKSDFIEAETLIFYFPTWGNGLLNKVLSRANDKLSTMKGDKAYAVQNDTKTVSEYIEITEEGQTSMTPLKGYSYKNHLAKSTVNTVCSCDPESPISEFNMPIPIAVKARENNEFVNELNSHKTSNSVAHALANIVNQLLDEQNAYADTLEEIINSAICIELLKISSEGYYHSKNENDKLTYDEDSNLRFTLNDVEPISFDPSVEINLDTKHKRLTDLFTKPGIFIISNKRLYKMIDVDFNSIKISGKSLPPELFYNTTFKVIDPLDTIDLNNTSTIEGAASDLNLPIEDLAYKFFSREKYSPEIIYSISNLDNISNVLIYRNGGEDTQTVKIISPRPPLISSGEILRNDNTYLCPLDDTYLFPFISGSISFDYYVIDNPGILESFVDPGIFKISEKNLLYVNNSKEIEDGTYFNSTLYTGYINDISNYVSSKYEEIDGIDYTKRYIVSRDNGYTTEPLDVVNKCISFKFDGIGTNINNIVLSNDYDSLPDLTLESTELEKITKLQSLVSEDRVFFTYKYNNENVFVKITNIDIVNDIITDITIEEALLEDNTNITGFFYVIKYSTEFERSNADFENAAYVITSNDINLNDAYITDGNYYKEILDIISNQNPDSTARLVLLEEPTNSDNNLLASFVKSDGIEDDNYIIPSKEFVMSMAYNEYPELSKDERYSKLREEENYNILSNIMRRYKNIFNKNVLKYMSCIYMNSTDVEGYSIIVDDTFVNPENHSITSMGTDNYFLHGENEFKPEVLDYDLTSIDPDNTTKDGVFLQDYINKTSMYYSKNQATRLEGKSGEDLITSPINRLIDLDLETYTKGDFDNNKNYVIASIQNDGTITGLFDSFMSSIGKTSSNEVIRLISELNKIELESNIISMIDDITDSNIMGEESQQLEVTDVNFSTYSIEYFDGTTYMPYLNFTSFTTDIDEDGTAKIRITIEGIKYRGLAKFDTKYYIELDKDITMNIALVKQIFAINLSNIASKFRILIEGTETTSFESNKEELLNTINLVESLMTFMKPIENNSFIGIIRKNITTNDYEINYYSSLSKRKGLAYYNYRKALFLILSSLDYYRTILVKLFLNCCSAGSVSELTRLEEGESSIKMKLYSFMNNDTPIYPIIEEGVIDTSSLDSIKINQIQQVITAGTMYYGFEYDINKMISEASLELCMLAGMGKPEEFDIDGIDVNNESIALLSYEYDLENNIINSDVRDEASTFSNAYTYDITATLAKEQYLRSVLAGDYFYKDTSNVIEGIQNAEVPIRYIRNNEGTYISEMVTGNIADVIKNTKGKSEPILPIKLSGKIESGQWFPYLSGAYRKMSMNCQEDIEFKVSQPKDISAIYNFDSTDISRINVINTKDDIKITIVQEDGSMETISSKEKFSDIAKARASIDFITKRVNEQIMEFYVSNGRNIDIPFIGNADVRLSSSGEVRFGESGIINHVINKVMNLSAMTEYQDLNENINDDTWYSFDKESNVHIANDNMFLSRRRAYYIATLVVLNLKKTQKTYDVNLDGSGISPFRTFGFGSLMTNVDQDGARDTFSNARTTFVAIQTKDLGVTNSTVEMNIVNKSTANDKGQATALAIEGVVPLTDTSDVKISPHSPALLLDDNKYYSNTNTGYKYLKRIYKAVNTGGVFITEDEYNNIISDSNFKTTLKSSIESCLKSKFDQHDPIGGFIGRVKINVIP